MNANAIILAAGKSSRFAPFTYEKPKGLFSVKNEILIERQIIQLQEAGIKDIYIVVGYMKEKFFYLEQKYGVKLIVNNKFNLKGNLYSLYMAREYLNNTFVCCADQFFSQNPFLAENIQNCSYRAVTFINDKFKEFAVEISDADVITNFQIGGNSQYAMVGHAYFNDKFSRQFCSLMEDEIDDFRVSSLFWEEFYAKHKTSLTLFAKHVDNDTIIEFDDIDDLKAFDSDFLKNVDSDIINNICTTLCCIPQEIVNISIINAGLTNVSFSFDVENQKYVYRHPGGTADNLINRQAEVYAQKIAYTNGLDKSVIKIDESGWKISRYVKDAKNCDFEKYDDQLVTGMAYLHKLHNVFCDENIKVFDNIAEGLKLMKIASASKGNLFKEFGDIIEKVKRLYEYIKKDADVVGDKLALCHNDTYEPNYLIDSDGDIYLIDWEYAGINYTANDIGCILCRYDWTEDQIERYLRAYVGHELSDVERRYYYGFIPISGFYWFCWGLYKGSVGDDDSFFFLPAYRNTIRFIDSALKSYGE